MKSRIVIPVFAILAIGPGTFVPAIQVDQNPSKLLRHVEEDEEWMQERSLLYRLRHGGYDQANPEERLRRIQAEYERRAKEPGQGLKSAQGGPEGQWVSLGPSNLGGRMTAIAPHPTSNGTIYAGAADGGLWKTTTAGASWVPLTDNINDLAVGAVAVAPSQPNTIYLGTGEGGGNLLGYSLKAQNMAIPGIGLLKSTDGGTTWAFPKSVIATEFYRISVHPTNPAELVIATNMGAHRSTDGGSSWTAVISPDTYDHVTDLVRDPKAPATIYATSWDAGLWCALSRRCQVLSPRLLKSTNGGVSWVEKQSALPVSTSSRRVSRMALAISPSNTSVLYLALAIQDTGNGSEISHVYKSTDKGETWMDLPGLGSSPVNTYLGRQAFYDNAIVVSPSNENVVVAGGVFYARTLDGGATWQYAPMLSGGTFNQCELLVTPGIHADVHDLRYQGSTLYIANDGGMWSSVDNGDNAVEINSNLVTRQYYGLAIDPVNRNRIFAGGQDNGTDRRTDAGGSNWTTHIIGADGFNCAINPYVPSLAYATAQGSAVYRFREAGRANYPCFTYLGPPIPSSEGRSFFSNLTMDPNEPSTLYVTSFLRPWRSTDGGDTWQPLSTTTTDGSPWEPGNTFGLAISRSNGSVIIIAKSSEGGSLINLFRTTDGGQTWRSAANGLPRSFINGVDIDPNNAETAYACVASTAGPLVYATTDGGSSWTARGTGLPDGFAAIVVRTDPVDSNVVYCGTDVGVYRSTNKGLSWAPYGTGLPSSSVQDIRLSDDAGLVRIATHGRGIWELQTTPSKNAAPRTSISTPRGNMTITKGTSLTFSGTISDPDAGDTVTGRWTFPDNWQSMPVAAGSTTVTHTFDRAGFFPVTLSARDSHRLMGASFVNVIVREPADDCGTAVVFPGNGPFPFTAQVNNEVATTQPSDPVPSCADSFSKSNRSLWFSFTPATAGTYEFATCDSSIDSTISVWTGPACGPYLPVAMGCNNDAAANSGCNGFGASFLTLNLPAGQTVRIMVSAAVGLGLGGMPVAVTVNRRN